MTGMMADMAEDYGPALTDEDEETAAAAVDRVATPNGYRMWDSPTEAKLARAFAALHRDHAALRLAVSTLLADVEPADLPAGRGELLLAVRLALAAGDEETER